MASLWVLDTNIVLYYLGGRLIEPLPLGQYYVSVITEMELLSYPSLSTEEATVIRNFLSAITVISLTHEIKELAIALRKQYSLKLPDAIIGATTQFLQATLLTNDTKLANLPEINVQSLRTYYPPNSP